VTAVGDNPFGGLTLPPSVKEMLLSTSPPVSPPSVGKTEEYKETDEEFKKRERMRAKVIEEIVETERKYLDDINILLDCYVVPLQKSGLMMDIQYADAMVSIEIMI